MGSGVILGLLCRRVAGNNGSFNTNYHVSIADRATVLGNGAFKNGSTASVAATDFDQSVTALNSYNQGSSSGGYTVRSGETLSSIAANLWGDASLWYKLAEVNGLSGQSALIEGQSLIVPAGVFKSTYNASTFKPYDPADIIGDTGPTTPIQPKPKKNKCGGFGQILLVVIAVAVSVVTAGAALAAFGAAANIGAGIGAVMSGTAGLAGAAAGAIGGAVGSVASQAVGVATGIQDRFSWNAVALAGISGAIGGGGGKMGVGGDGWASAAGRAMVSSAVTQGIGVATGMQKNFSWAGVAAAGVGAAFADKVFSSKALQGVGDKFGRTSVQYAARALQRGTASAIGNAATRSLIEGTDFGDNVMVALPDVIGQTMGDLIAGRIGNAAQKAYEDRQAAATDAPANEVADPQSTGNLYAETIPELSWSDQFSGVNFELDWPSITPSAARQAAEEWDPADLAQFLEDSQNPKAQEQFWSTAAAIIDGSALGAAATRSEGGRLYNAGWEPYTGENLPFFHFWMERVFIGLEAHKKLTSAARSPENLVNLWWADLGVVDEIKFRGGRPDLGNSGSMTIWELKPNNERQIALGKSDLKWYVSTQHHKNDRWGQTTLLLETYSIADLSPWQAGLQGLPESTIIRGFMGDFVYRYSGEGVVVYDYYKHTPAGQPVPLPLPFPRKDDELKPVPVPVGPGRRFPIPGKV